MPRRWGSFTRTVPRWRQTFRKARSSSSRSSTTTSGRPPTLRGEHAAGAVELAEVPDVLPRAPEDVLVLRPRDLRVGVPAVRQRLHADYPFGVSAAGTTPFWLDAPYEPRSPLEGDIEVEACVIGGGVGGLSCARRLAQHGIETVLLEAGTVAGGASGRNGGFLIAGTAAFHNDARERYGVERARAMYARTLEAQREIYELAAELGAGDSLRRVGLLRLAVSEEEAEHVRDHARALREDGFPGESSSATSCRPRCGAPASWPASPTTTARSTPRAGTGCSPAPPRRPARASARAARCAGPCLRRTRARWSRSAAACARATWSWRPTARCRRSCRSTRGACARAGCTWSRPSRCRRRSSTLVYARWGYEYLQQRPDGRILAGGFSDVDGDGSYTRQRRRQPGDLGASRALPARGPRRRARP